MSKKLLVGILLILVVVPTGYVIYEDTDVEEVTSPIIQNNQEISFSNNTPDASYDISISENGSADFNVSYKRESNQSYNRFNEKQLIPYDSFEVSSVSDSQGNLGYNVKDKRVIYTSKSDSARQRAFFNVNYTAQVDTRGNISDSLNQYIIKTSGSEDRSQSIRISSESRILSLYTSTDHTYDRIDNHTTVVEGSGPMTTILIAGNPDKVVENVAVFDESSEIDSIPYDEIRKGYISAVSTTGVERKNILHSLVVVDNDEFESEFGGQTEVSGTYRAGVLYIPSSVITGETSKSIVAHEITHSLNGQITPYFPDWFDEGTAMFAQISTADRFDEPHSYPFSQESSYECGGTNCIVTHAEGDGSNLVEYIKEDSTYMSEERWDELSSFRYAYSSLLINDVIRQTENNSLVPVYQKLVDDRARIHDNENKDNMTSIMIDNLDMGDINPCSDFYEGEVSDEKVEDCIETNNEVLGHPNGFSRTILSYRFDLDYKEVTLKEKPMG